MGPTGCPETSGSNYRYTLRNIAEERKSQVKVTVCSVCEYFQCIKHIVVIYILSNEIQNVAALIVY